MLLANWNFPPQYLTDYLTLGRLICLIVITIILINNIRRNI